MPPPPPHTTTTSTTTSSRTIGSLRLACGGAAVGDAAAPPPARGVGQAWRGHRSAQRKMCHCKTPKRTPAYASCLGVDNNENYPVRQQARPSNNETRALPEETLCPRATERRDGLKRTFPSCSSSSTASLLSSAVRTRKTCTATVTLTTTEDVPTPRVEATPSHPALAQRIPTMNDAALPELTAGQGHAGTRRRVSGCADMADAGGLWDRDADYATHTRTATPAPGAPDGECQRKKRRKRRGQHSGDVERMSARDCTPRHPAFVNRDQDSTDRLTGKDASATQEGGNDDNTPLTAFQAARHADERLRVPLERDANDNCEGNNKSNRRGADGGGAYSCWYPATSKVAKHVRQVPCWWLPGLWLRMWFTWWATWFRPNQDGDVNNNNSGKNKNKDPKKNGGKWSSPAAKWIWLSLLLCSFVSFAQSQGVPEHGSDSNAAKGICGSMDIRNEPSNLEQLRNCRVIEGHLKFVLMDHVNASEFANYTYPELREITDYFMMYRVFGLKTLRHLFPNLAVIRGQNLFQNYAFIVFECNHLQDVALPSLTHISRGTVRIEKNPNLCYIDTVNWHSITGTSGDMNFFKENKPVENCPTRTSCPQNCPAPNEPRSRYCWSNSVCQKICVCDNQTVCPLPANVISSTKCCHSECLGDCTGPESHQCIACRNVLYQNQCRKLCPPDTYLFNERRCLTDSECISQAPPESSSEAKQPWVPFEGVCRRECPPGYQMNETKSQNGAGLNVYSCVPCSGSCPKLCHGMSVDSIEKAQSLKGCTIITGALEIQVKGGENIVRELVENLSQIEEVQDYVKIVRSYPLVSLDFLQNLRKIGGKNLENYEYALVVLDNPNLQELWDWERKGRNLTIERGKLFFHFNPHLCFDKIVELQNITNTTETDKDDIKRYISPHTNGDKAACETKLLDLKVTIANAEGAIIRWENYEGKMVDPRALLGYVVSYIEAPEQNITYYSGRDACGGDGWRVDDTAIGAETDLYIDYFMPNLEPATQYAVYVQTFKVASVDKDARSPIVYFTTKPAKPSIPVQLKAFSNSSSEIVVTWKEPSKPNGNVTHYVITARWVEDDRELVDQRNYCSEPFTPDTGKASKSQEGQDSRGVTISQPISEDKGECCACSKNKPKPKSTDAESERDLQISFENAVQNTVYKRREDADTTRRKRDTSLNVGREFPEKPSKETSIPTVNETLPPIQRDSRGRYISFHFNVANATTYILRSLRHFAEYTIEVVACHDLDPDNLSVQKRCSDKAITTARTAPSPYADDIHEGIKATVSNSTDQVKISWKEPEDPNGLVVNYHIEYRRVETDKLKKEVCVPRKDYIANDEGYVIASLAPGNYSAEIKATSLYGKSTRSSHIVYFQIPEPSSGMISVGVIIGCVIMLIVVIVLAVSLWYHLKKKKDGKVTISQNPEYLPADGVYVQDEWEVARDKIEILRELGKGSFGMVYEGVIKDISPGKPIVKCAVKTVNEDASIRERIEFLNEASVMKTFNCNHVVRLLGVVSVGQPTLVVMELMARGDLKSYLRSHRPDNDDNVLHNRLPPTLKSVLQMAIEIADGMSYLAAKKYVHRDLAARNCMVAEDLTVKVGDFGMTRDVYTTDYYRKGGKGLLPVRWMSPESLKDGVFTSQSDVWSFGVVLWEMATLASQPYQGLANEQVLNYVMKGGVMEKPEGCPDRMFELMSSCWRFKAFERPSFFDIVESLLSETKPTFEQVSFHYSKEGQEARKDQKELEEKHLRSSHSEDPSTPLLLTVTEHGEREQVVEMEDDDDEEDGSDGEDHHEDDSDAGSHVRIMYPAGPIYVRALGGGPVGVIRDPSWDMQNLSNSRSDGSHSTGKTISSEGSKNSHNGSANGYVSGILQHRRNGPDCC